MTDIAARLIDVQAEFVAVNSRRAALISDRRELLLDAIDNHKMSVNGLARLLGVSRASIYRTIGRDQV